MLQRIWGTLDDNRTRDIVFVHGLDGDAVKTWHHKESPDLFWPAWLGEDLGNVAVWSLNYDAASLAWKGTAMPLTDRATYALAAMEADGIGSRPVVFVTHSLGGLLVKQMLRHANDYGQPAWKELSDHTRGVVFLATPHSGSDIASWLRYVSIVLKANVTVEDLRAHDPALRNLNLWFRTNASRLNIPCEAFFETKLVAGFIVVNETSADPGIQGVIPIPVDANHIDICKVKSRQELVYRRVRQFIIKAFDLPGPPAAVSPAATNNNPSVVDKQAQAPKLSVFPIQGVNFVRLGYESETSNAVFTFSLTVNLICLAQSYVLMGFDAYYIGPDGCYCLNNEIEMAVNGVQVATAGNGFDFNSPLPVTNGMVKVVYGRRCRPPLMVQAPVDCDYGDIRVRVSILWDDLPETVEYLFRFEAGGNLTSIDRLRAPPILADSTLEKMKSRGLISADEFNRATDIDERRRYQIVKFKDYIKDAYSRSSGSIIITDEFRRFLDDLRDREFALAQG